MDTLQQPITRAEISAHHGYTNRSNELAPTINLIQSNPDIDIIEIDFIYNDGIFISSHTYDAADIAVGSNLVEWIEKIVPMKKILWLDIKDTELSIFTAFAGKFDVSHFFKILNSQWKKLLDRGIRLQDWLIMSSQYEHIQRKLIKRNPGYTIVHDLPFAPAYVAQRITPTCMDTALDYFVKEYIESETNTYGSNQIVCLDISFFESVDHLVEFIKKINVNTFIVYSLSLDNETDIQIPGKKIIYQYDYILLDTELE